MSKIVITCAMTVDGLIEAPAPRPHGWLVLEGDSEQAQFDVFNNSAGMLIGRKNYEQDLVDELLFYVNPSIQGAGQRPFHGAAVELELLESRQFDSGVALLRYRPHGVGAAR